MISLFRRHLQGRFLRYVIYVISFFVIFPSAFMIIFKWFEGDMWVLKVNRRSVGVEEYQQRIFDVQQQIARFKQIFGENADQFLKMQGLGDDPQRIAIDSLIDQKLLEGVARQLHITLSQAYVNQQLIRMVPRDVVQPDGSINLAQLAYAHNMSVEQLRNQLTNQMLATLVMQLTEGAVYVPQFLVKERFIQAYTPRSFLIAELPLQKLIKEESKNKPSDQELKKFFDAENRKNKRYWVSEKRSGFVWKFDGNRYPVKITDKQIEKYYNQNKHKEFIDQPGQVQVRHILLKFTDQNKAAVRAKLAQVKKELGENGTLFAERAKEFSEDVATKKKGGLTEFFARGIYDPSFEQAAFRLAKDGDISPIIEVPGGFELIQRVAKKAQTFKSLDQAKNEITNKLRGTQFNRSFPADVRRALAQEDALTALEELAKNRGGKKAVLPLQEKGSEPYMQKFFIARKGSGGSSLTDSEGYAFYISDIKKSYQPSFEEAKERLLNDFYHKQSLKKLETILKDAEKITEKDKFEEFAEKHRASIESTGTVSQQMGDKVQRLIKRMGTSATQLFMLTVPGKVLTFVNGDTGFIVCLEQIAPFDEKIFEEQKQALRQQMYQEQKQLTQEAFIASLYKNATIKVNEKIIKL
ncbi:TPA: hypothetical protein DIC20_04480 [Candidatus Dependentiae bacterium]|nr:MAG: Parvulin-like protein peptidyl-prolyl isomerase [candidate division TM6 bacterium GW2011_GWF2_36_131]KKQ03183.1 MAG: Parvulin-like protein peptidyl-prolyl isomerase [candidate division TM6 bacterium GW2011_GWE2_36_25]KKQ18541.1 MAG: Parvulin-like protein peptidyl-prolyl isomerase [candidate division TM6 bacterium GW2011_GWA2_36_9]HBR70387.1 hypothetical protein [Candidatus Dependentiae bacterium]HCU00932.1 hypothetical protein [Candidatus Dependentiae bacterium]